MIDYPVCLRLQNKRVLVIGGGRIAEGKIGPLLAAGARVHVIAPRLTPLISELAASGRVELTRREYRRGDLQGAALVLSATDDAQLSQAMADEARSLGVWLNAADEPSLCDFTLPSVGREGPITIAVSTSGQAPAVAARVRRKLVSSLGRGDRGRASLSGWIRAHMRRSERRTKLLRLVATFGLGELT